MMQDNLKFLNALMGGYYLYSAFLGYQADNTAEIVSSLILATMFCVMLFKISTKTKLSILVVLFLALVGTEFYLPGNQFIDR